MTLSGWDEKIADLMNHGLNDEEIPNQFNPEEMRNCIRDYSAQLRSDLKTECANVINDLTCEERGAVEPCEYCRNRIAGRTMPEKPEFAPESTSSSDLRKSDLSVENGSRHAWQFRSEGS